MFTGGDLTVEDGRVQGVPEPVDAEDVQAAGAHIGRRGGHRVQDPLHTGPDPLGALRRGRAAVFAVRARSNRWPVRPRPGRR